MQSLSLSQGLLPAETNTHAGTPKQIIARLNTEVLRALEDADVRHKLEDLGFAIRGSAPEELGAMTRDQLAKYARVIKEMGIGSE
jgi:tripartite-type tricarboxylate transporter receptor subunit TctC